MSTIAIRREPSKGQVATTAGWDPRRTICALRSRDPFQDAADPRGQFAVFACAPFDVSETREAYEFTADVPGVHERDLDVAIAGNRLTVSATRAPRNDDRSRTERACCRRSFTHSFTLPECADIARVHASFDRGVLLITAPKGRTGAAFEEVGLRSLRQFTAIK